MWWYFKIEYNKLNDTNKESPQLKMKNRSKKCKNRFKLIVRDIATETH